MTVWQVAGLAWLALSVVLAPMVGRLIHNRAECPVCRARAARKRNAHRWWDA